MTKPLSYYFIPIITAFTLLTAYASDAPILTGSSLKLKEEVASATEIVIGTFTELNEGASFTLSGNRYRAQIVTSDILKGNALVSSKVAFLVVPENKETAPNFNEIYIMIIDHQRIHMLLPATEDNIAKVKALIAH